MNKLWRKLDNTAKGFSLGSSKYTNTFRLYVTLKSKVNPKLLKLAVNKVLDKYPCYKVKLKSGFFWNYLMFNDKKVIVYNEDDSDFDKFNLKQNNDYLFKVTCSNNRIYLDVSHILTDGLGGIIFLKYILYNYLDIKYNLLVDDKESNCLIDFKDEYLNNVNKKLVCKRKVKKSFLIKGKSFFTKSRTNYYKFNLDKFKLMCKKYSVSVTEYLVAIYIYALYKTIYDKKSHKDIILTVPIDLRKYYNVKSFSNFFTCMNIESNVVGNKKVTFESLLEQVHSEFKNKLNDDDIPKYLSRDVKLGTNLGIHFVPLFIKKTFMKIFSNFGKSTTSTFSNVGSIDIDKKYKKYISDVVAFANAGRIQKIKCTVCSYENNLTITINSNLINNDFENEFSRLLEKYISEFK